MHSWPENLQSTTQLNIIYKLCYIIISTANEYTILLNSISHPWNKYLYPLTTHLGILGLKIFPSPLINIRQNNLSLWSNRLFTYQTSYVRLFALPNLANVYTVTWDPSCTCEWYMLQVSSWYVSLYIIIWFNSRTVGLVYNHRNLFTSYTLTFSHT